MGATFLTMTMLCVLLLFAVGCFIPMTWAGEYAFEVQCDAPKTEYRLHEPIAITFKVKNVSARSVILHTSADGSDSFTVLFSCTNPAIKDRAKMLTFFEGLTGGGIARKYEFKPGQTISGVRHLNREIDLGIEGKFDIGYELIMSYDYPERVPGKMLAKLESKGKLTVAINKERLRREDIDPILARWGQSSQQMREVMGALALIDDPLVIPLLVKYAREAPNKTGEAAIALRKFMSKKEGIEALEALGAEYFSNETFLIDGVLWQKEQGFGESSVGMVYGSFMAMDRFPSEGFLKEQLASKIDYRVAAALDYLLRAQQKANSAPLEEIERLQEHKNKAISETAGKVIEKMSKLKVKDDF